MPTLSDLKKIIGEEVKKAVRAELKDLILEAVEIASRPEQKHSKPVYSENVQRTVQVVPKRKEENRSTSNNMVQNILAETAASMTSEDYENIYGTSTKASLAESYSDLGEEDTVIEDSVPSVGIDLDNLPSFVKNAKAILDASIAKDRERHAV